MPLCNTIWTVYNVTFFVVVLELNRWSYRSIRRLEYRTFDLNAANSCQHFPIAQSINLKLYNKKCTDSLDIRNKQRIFHDKKQNTLCAWFPTCSALRSSRQFSYILVLFNPCHCFSFNHSCFCDFSWFMCVCVCVLFVPSTVLSIIKLKRRWIRFDALCI